MIRFLIAFVLLLMPLLTRAQVKIKKITLNSIVIYDDTTLLRKYVDRGLDLDKQYFSLNNTFYHEAALHTKPALLAFLAQNKANINVLNKYGATPIQMALFEPNLKTIRFLAEQGADLNTVPSHGYTLLTSLVEKAGIARDLDAHLELISYLIDKGADPEYACGECNYNTVLMTACKYDTPELVNLLLEKKVKIDRKNDLGRTALYFAAEAGNKKVVETLLAHNADAGIKDLKGETAADVARKLGREDIVNLLAK